MSMRWTDVVKDKQGQGDSAVGPAELDRDLDQALHIERDDHGYRVRYAIADVPAFVRPGGAIDAESFRRGQTIYAPDHRTPLHPEQLSEDAASLLPDRVRPGGDPANHAGTGQGCDPASSSSGGCAAGYTPFDGGVPELTRHAAVGAPYAHVTAPLRRQWRSAPRVPRSPSSSSRLTSPPAPCASRWSAASENS